MDIIYDYFSNLNFGDLITFIIGLIAGYFSSFAKESGKDSYEFIFKGGYKKRTKEKDKKQIENWFRKERRNAVSTLKIREEVLVKKEIKYIFDIMTELTIDKNYAFGRVYDNRDSEENTFWFYKK